MNRIFRFLLSGLVAIVLMAAVSACSESSDYTKALPGDVSMLFKVDVAQLAGKSEAGARSFMTDIREQITNDMDEDARNAVEDVLENPMKSGLDVRKPVYVAFKQKGVNDMEVAVVVAVDDKARLQSFIEKVGKDEFELRKSGNVVILDMGALSTVSAAFDDCAFVISSSTSNDAKRLLAQSVSESAVVKMQHFDALAADNRDIAMLMDYNSFSENLQEMGGLQLDIIKDLYVLSGLNFEDGRIALYSQTYCTEKYREYIKNFRMDAEGRYMSCAPLDTWGMFMFATKNLDSILNIYSQEILDQLNQLLGQVGLTQSDLSEIEGDVMAACLPLANYGNNLLPQGMLMVHTKSSKLWDAIAPIMPAEKTVAPGVFALGVNASDDYYLGFVDNTIFVMPKNIYNQVVKEGKIAALNSNFTSARCADLVKKGGFAVDVQAVVNSFRQSDYAQDPSVMNVLNYIARIDNLHSSYSEDMLSGEFCIDLCDKSNALKQIFDIVEEMNK